LGGLDEAPLALAGALDLPPAIGGAARLAVLARLIRARDVASGSFGRADMAWLLAGDLASLMDDAERAGIDLRAGLEAAADPAQAEHWARILDFLRIVTEAWPAYLVEQGLINPAARQVALMQAQAAAWAEVAPASPVLAVSAAGDIPAVAGLLRVIASLPAGCVVLPGLDLDLADAVWAQLDEAHPQHGLASLLAALGARRGDVRVCGESAVPGRVALLRQALLPAAALAAWQVPVDFSLVGLTRLAPADPQAEAVAIAMILRDALEQPGAQAALVTPDRGLAVRVAAELRRWGIVADDSAGESLAQTPPAVFLRLIADAVMAGLAPVPLLALLKHPLAALGLSPAALRGVARQLEVACLRGPKPGPGLAGLRRAVDRAATDPTLGDLLARLEAALAPLLRAVRAVRIAPAELMACLIAAGEALAASDAEAGPARLWAFEEGEALAQLLAETQEALPALPDDDPACLPGLLDAVLAGAVVRGRRAIRGGGGAEHPRVSIWGLLEARLQQADVLVLAGLNEGVWPPATDPGPWMSRAMRARAGLASPELLVGQAAHDFCMSCCAAPLVVLSAPLRRDGAPAVPSRWLARLDALLGEGLALHPAAGWARLLDVPDGGARPAVAPRPCPPVAVRPRRLSVTEIATLKRDPYAIYARRILGLEALAPLEQAADFSDYGSIVHQGLHGFLAGIGAEWPADAEATLGLALERAMRAAGVRPVLLAWWAPRLRRIAQWVDGEERRRRAEMAVVRLGAEVDGKWVFPGPAGDFTLSGRADRIELRADGRLALLDYKTGTLPTARAVAFLEQPQLPLEAAMAAAGGFGPQWTGAVETLLYWRLSGDHAGGASRAAGPEGVTVAQLAEAAADDLRRLIETFDAPDAVYAAAAAGEEHSPYRQLARAGEWGGERDEAVAEEAE
jgi:ATP-dependent helicase/nuclease subunit B